MGRPAQLALIVLVYGLGAVVVLRTVQFDPSSLVGGLVALLPVAVSVHYVNEYADYETDTLTDRTPFSGGSGALQRTGLDRAFAWRAAWAALVLGVAAAVVCAVHGFTATTIGILTVIGVVGWQYSVGPLALVWRGAGEVTNAVLGGLLLPLYGAATQTGSLEPQVALAMVPFTIMVLVNLLATHWPDREADAAVGKSTLPTRWDPPRLRLTYAVLTIVAALVLLGLTGAVVPPLVTVASLPAFVVAAWGYTHYTRQESPFPAVAAMVTLALCQTAAWLWLVAA
jgi:1,4-dihydroxy-2-naphthoate octaprenyltransferase